MKNLRLAVLLFFVALTSPIFITGFIVGISVRALVGGYYLSHDLLIEQLKTRKNKD